MKHYDSGGLKMISGKPHKRRHPHTEEELARRQLLRDVINRLDYEDLKHSMVKERKRSKVSHISSGLGGSHHDVYTHAQDVVLPKVERILMDLRALEEKDTLRMRQIDISLAELCAPREGDAG